MILAISLAILIDDGSPVIYSQKRVGKDGKEFTLYKFRSMRKGTENDGVPHLYVGTDNTSDTRVGVFLRRHHLDEFPQLWNVLKGDMSFVGYRPERRYFIDKIMERNPDYQRLFAIRPGLFSRATLYNGYTDSIEKMLIRLDMDLEYLEHHNLWDDFVIIMKTTFSVITGKVF